MTKKKNIIYIYFLLIMEIILLVNSNYVISNIKESMIIFSMNIFPTLFPTMIVGNLLSICNIELIIPNFIKKTFKYICNFDEYKTSIFILSILCGSPSSSLILNSYYEKKLITNDDLIYMSYVTQFINPLFIIGFVGIGIFNSKLLGFLLFFLLIITNIIRANKLKNKFSYNIEKKLTNNNINITKNLLDSINNAISSSFIILSLVIIFSLLTFLIQKTFNLNSIFTFIINALLEITGGLNKLKYLNISVIIKFILSYFILNFGGICIHMQTILINKNKKIRYFKYLIYRFI